MKRKLFSIGESLIDFIPDRSNVGLDEVKSFKKAAGGAPANVAVCAARLGADSYFVGKISNDGFGNYLYETITGAGVKPDYIFRTDKEQTALAFVALKNDGDRDFSFYRNRTADLMLDKEEVKTIPLKEGDIIHFCSVALVDSPSKIAHRAFIERGIKSGALISFDVNVRLPLYDSPEVLKKTVYEFLPLADLIKVSEDELVFLTDILDETRAVAALFSMSARAKGILVTKGGNGSVFFTRDLTFVKTAAVKVKAIDTTGAGDCFIGCMLYKFLSAPEPFDKAEIAAAMRFASVGAAVTVTKNGAIEAMPEHSEIEARLSSQSQIKG